MLYLSTLLFATLAFAVPSFSQDKTPKTTPPETAPVTSFITTINQKLIYKTSLPPEVEGGNIIDAQEHVSVAAIKSDGTISLHVKVFKVVDDKLQLKEQGSIDWQPIPEHMLRELFEKKKDQLVNETLVVDNQSFSCVKVPLSPTQTAWIVVDKNRKNVFPGVLKMTLAVPGQATPVTIMKLIKIVSPTKSKGK